MKTKDKKVVDVSDWDDLVTKTYGRPYNFQQQDDCKPRGTFDLSIPSEYTDDFENDSVPEKINGSEMGVSFKAWLERDPKQAVGDRKDEWEIGIFWDRNFYPDIHTLANDMHDKGVVEAGEYLIDIDW